MFWKAARVFIGTTVGLGTSSFWTGSSAFESSSSASSSFSPPFSTAECRTNVELSDPIKVKSKSKGRRQVFSGRFKEYTLAEIIPVSHDVALFRFLLHDPEDEFNLWPCSTLQACFKSGTNAVEQCHRFYTPVTANGSKGHFDLIVKRKTGGKMTDFLFGMHVGDKLSFRLMAFKVKYYPNRWDNIGMIAGGTGFTPMLQVIRHALTNPLDAQKGVVDKTRLSFLFCNRTEKHILLKGLFDKLAQEYPQRFKMHYCVDTCLKPEKWTGYTGYVTPQMIRETMPPPSSRNHILVCGPDHLLQHVCGTSLMVSENMSGAKPIQPVALDQNNLTPVGGVLGSLGFDDSMVFRF